MPGPSGVPGLGEQAYGKQEIENIYTSVEMAPWDRI